VRETPALRDGLLEREDYELVRDDVWMKFMKWYGGGPAFCREVVSNGVESVVEVYRMKFTVRLEGSASEAEVDSGLASTVREIDDVSSAITVSGLAITLRDYFPALPKEIEICDPVEDKANPVPLEEYRTLKQLQLVSGQELVVRRKRQKLQLTKPEAPHSNGFANGSAPVVTSAANGAATFRFPEPAASTASQRTTTEANYALEMPGGAAFNTKLLSPKAGLTGLSNLGNTCFMNSALQCLSNTPDLTSFFLSGAYVNDVNPDNPIGMGGLLAQNYARVLKVLWSGESTSYSPRLLKTEIAHFAPQFSGYAQQDSQELLAFLLDGIHEDLNRIRKKPFVENIEGGARPDSEVADESWANHKKRHDSIIVDLFQGQYKSTVVCPTCNKVSVTFDPFMYLTLPLPSKRTQTLTFTLFRRPTEYAKSSRPVKYSIQIEKTATVRTLRHAIGKLVHIEPSRLFIADCVILKLYDIPFLDSKKVEDTFREMTYSSSFMVYEVDHDIEIAVNGSCSLFTPLRSYDTMNGTLSSKQETPNLVILDVSQKVEGEPTNVAVPFVLTFDRKEVTGLAIAQAVKARAARYVDFEAAERQISEAGKKGSGSVCKVTVKYKDSIETIEIDPLSSDPLALPPKVAMVSVFVEWGNSDWVDRDEAGIKAVDEDESVGDALVAPTKPQVTLQTCLSLWGEEETLSEENAWYCSQCREHKMAKKSLRLWRAPEILVVHLKRFSYTTYSRNKVESFVEYPLENLDLSEFIAGPCPMEGANYDLYAISNHYGGLGGGHYTAYAKSPWKQEGNGVPEKTGWYNFDDSYVSPVSNLPTIKSNNAYVLFYKRRKAA